MDVVNLSDQQVLTLTLVATYLVVLPLAVTAAAVVGSLFRRRDAHRVADVDPIPFPTEARASAPATTVDACSPGVAA